MPTGLKIIKVIFDLSFIHIIKKLFRSLLVRWLSQNETGVKWRQRKYKHLLMLTLKTCDSYYLFKKKWIQLKLH